MSASALFNLDIRSYGADQGPEHHAFAQLVLPLRGALVIDIAGRESEVTVGCSAFVHAGVRHSTMGNRANRALVVDLDPKSLNAALTEQRWTRPFSILTPAANRLVDYMDLTFAPGAASRPTADHWLALLIDAWASEASGAPSRLSRLMARVEAEPAASWTTLRMASVAGLSVSSLHAHFRAEFATTPHEWLSGVRIGRAREWLAASDESIAGLALRAGYADQSALTRAMRRATGLTPAAWRRRSRETATKPS